LSPIAHLSDLGRIQTCNLLSRNQMRYSVAPRGRLWGANIADIIKLPKALSIFERLF
jgi:hypothetical protein